MITFIKTALLFSLLVLTTSSVFAERGGFGGYHGGGGNFGGYHGGGNDAVIYHGNNDAFIHRDNEFQGGVIVTPGVSCTTEQVCDSYGQCSLQQNCD